MNSKKIQQLNSPFLMSTKRMLTLLVVITSLIAISTSCVKQKFDNPPDSSSYDPGLTVTSTIANLKSKFGTTPVMIDSDLVIQGIVTADDRTGAFYKQIVIQDSTSGILVLIGKTGLYGDYPIGRKVYIKCKGLWLGAYGSFIQLGYTPDITNSLSDIPAPLVAEHIVKANTGNVVTPKVVSISQIKTINNSLMGMLIQIDSAEVIASEVGSPYAQDPNIASGTDRHIEDCAGTQIVCRMSGYATYRNEPLPAGKGPITAIYSRYNNTAQLLIRDTTDLKFNGTRCGGVVILPPVDITIDSLRKLYTTTGIVLGNYKIHGVVTSSYKDSNMSKGGLYMQDESGRGINIYYGNKVLTYNLGDSITVDVSGDSLIVYRGNLEVKKKADKTTLNTTGKTVTPMIVTIADLNADLDNPTYSARKYESVVVKIMNCTINGTGGFFSGNNNLVDATGTIISYCRNAPPFSTTALPTGTFNMTGLAVKYFTTNEITMRKLPNDIQ